MRVAALSCAVGCLLALGACRAPRQSAPIAEHSNVPLAELRADLLGGRVPMAEVRVADSPPLGFIVDTGADSELVEAGWARRLGLRVENPELVPEPGGPVPMGKVGPVPISVGGLTVTDSDVVSVPLLALSPVIGRPLDGLLGHTLLRRYVVELDYDRQRLAFFDPASYRASSSSVELPLEISAIDAYVRVTLVQRGAAPKVAKLELDTGSFDALGLDSAFVEEQGLAPASRPRVKVPGVAIGGETSGFRTELDALEVGPFRFESVPLGATPRSPEVGPIPYDGTLGAEVLRRFKVVLDYPHSRMFLEKSAQFGEPFETDASGLVLRAQGDGFERLIVHQVVPGSPAADAGLQPGDILTDLDGRTVSGKELAPVWRTLLKPGVPHTLVVLRQGTPRDVRLVTRRMF